jgi:hypothetical protein
MSIRRRRGRVDVSHIAIDVGLVGALEVVDPVALLFLFEWPYTVRFHVL